MTESGRMQMFSDKYFIFFHTAKTRLLKNPEMLDWTIPTSVINSTMNQFTLERDFKDK